MTKIIKGDKKADKKSGQVPGDVMQLMLKRRYFMIGQFEVKLTGTALYGCSTR
jgi:hypothetical protein